MVSALALANVVRGSRRIRVTFFYLSYEGPIEILIVGSSVEELYSRCQQDGLSIARLIENACTNPIKFQDYNTSKTSWNFAGTIRKSSFSYSLSWECSSSSFLTIHPQSLPFECY